MPLKCTFFYVEAFSDAVEVYFEVVPSWLSDYKSAFPLRVMKRTSTEFARLGVALKLFTKKQTREEEEEREILDDNICTGVPTDST